jgi:hypothetical protein
MTTDSPRPAGQPATPAQQPAGQPATPARQPRPFTDTRQFKVMRGVMGAASPFIRRVLASRFPGPMAKALMILRVRGRKSGAWKSFPVGYVREGDLVVAVTSPGYTWWPNLLGGAPVQVRLQGRWYAGHGRIVLPDDADYDETVAFQVGKRGPSMLRQFGVPVTDDGRVPDEVRAQAPTRAHMVRIELEGEIPEPA